MQDISEDEQVGSGDPYRRKAFPYARPLLGLLLLGGVAAAVFVATRAGTSSDPGSPPRTSTAPGRFDEHIRRERQIELAESPSVLNVNPRIEVDRLGGLLVADANEAQVRRYAPDGSLLWAFGRKGRGPGEFLRLSTALRTRGDTILAAEMGGRISLLDPTGARLARLRESGLGPLYDGTPVGDSLVVFAAREGGKVDTPLLHVWRVASDSIVSRFFHTPPAPKGLESTYAFAGTADVAARGDTLAAVFALTDTVFLFDVRGRRLGRVPLPFLGFRRPTTPMPKQASLEEYREWSRGFSAISQIHWLTDGSFLVQYFDTDGVNPSWRLLHVSRKGERLFEILDSPQLLAVSRADDSLYFATPEAETPASLTFASVVR